MNIRTARSALVQFAFEECANQVHRGQCVMRNEKPCRLGDGTRCGYFEACVFPIATRGLRAQRPTRPIDDKRVVTAFCAVWPAALGKIVLHADDVGARTCPDCGGPLPARKRACASCRERRRRTTYRKSKDSARSLSTVTPENTPKTPMFSGANLPESGKQDAAYANAPDGPITVDTEGTTKGTNHVLLHAKR